MIRWRQGELSTIAKGGQDTLPGGGILGYTLSPVAMNLLGEAAFVMTRDGSDLPTPLGFHAGVYRYSPRTGVVPVMVPGLGGQGRKFLGFGVRRRDQQPERNRLYRHDLLHGEEFHDGRACVSG